MNAVGAGKTVFSVRCASGGSLFFVKELRKKLYYFVQNGFTIVFTSLKSCCPDSSMPKMAQTASKALTDSP